MQDLKAYTNRRTTRHPKSRVRLNLKGGESAVIAGPAKRRTHVISPLSKPFWTRLFATDDPVELRYLIRGLMLTLSSTLVLAAVGWMAWGTDIGFIEKFALSEDRKEALKLLIPGTPDYYYYHCLDAQLRGDKATVKKHLELWIKRHGRTAQVKCHVLSSVVPTSPQPQSTEVSCTFPDNSPIATAPP